uniref:AMP deaminase n=1 Tax=Lactuca sativa TaxID=4236 RepID=A0A9R1UDC6_LACSA|nr:hypothetical protein LSAT_V11C900473030 [Lactuca sativa]
MNQKHLLRFVKSKLRKEPYEIQVVIFRDGTYLTLKEVFKSLDLTGYDLDIDLLDVHADKSTFHRLDKFNLKYNPCGQSRLQEIFLKQDNLIQGCFLAKVTSQVFVDLEASKYQAPNLCISSLTTKTNDKVSGDFFKGIRIRLVEKDFAPKWDILNLDIRTFEPELNLPTSSQKMINDGGFQRAPYVIDIGQNDIVDAFSKKYSYTQVVKRIPLALAEIKNSIKSIHDNGGRTFLKGFEHANTPKVYMQP